MPARQRNTAEVRGAGAVFILYAYGFGCGRVMGRHGASAEVIHAARALV